MRYKYKIEIQYINPKTSESTPIEVQCIKSLCIDRNFEFLHMPVAFVNLVLDKNLIDDMIKNMNKNRLHISLYKFALEGDQALEKVFDEQFTYSVDKDINYRNGMDYTELEKEQNGGKNRKDVFENIQLGIMCKKNLDNNAHYTNKVLKNCTVEECLVKEFEGLDILIEPFENVEKKDSIIITPTETYYQLLEKLNTIDGFYSTPFRFFLDYNMAYLLSSSGNMVKAKNEKYSSVNIEIRSISNSQVDAYSPGFEIDNEHSCYKIPISTDNSVYQINHITSKYQNDIKAVIDASRDVKSQNTSKKNVIQKLADERKKLNEIVQTNISKIANIGNDLNSIGHGLDDDVKLTTKVCNKLNKILLLSDSSFSPWVNHKCEIGGFHSIGEALEFILSIKGSISNLASIVVSLPTEFKNMKDSLFATAYRTTNIGSFLNCVTEIHYNDNVKGAKDFCSKLLEEAAKNVGRINESNYNRTVTIYNILTSNSRNIINVISSIPKHFQMRQDGTDPEPEDPPEELIDVDLSGAIEMLEQMYFENDQDMGGNNVDSILTGCGARLKQNVATLLSSQTNSQGIAAGCSKNISTIMGIPNNLTDEFSGKATGLVNQVISKDPTAKIKNTNAITLDQKAMQTYGADTINSIKDNINAAGNLNGLGSTGLSEVDTSISMDGSSLLKDETKKTIMLRIPNDNVNILKQESAKVKLSAYVLSINKFDLDTQLFTPNKSYTVKNFDGHSNQDGKFILAMTKECFAREDDVFRLLTVAKFRKAVE